MIVSASATAVENCPGECTHPAAVDTTHYDTLEEAIAAAESGSTVTMLQDITITSGLTVSKKLTLDLGGKTLTVSLPAASDVALKFTKSGTVCNGKVDACTGVALEAAGCTVTIEKDAQLASCGTAPLVVMSAANGSNAKVNVSGFLSGNGSSPVIYTAPSAKGSCDLCILKKATITNDAGVAVALNCAGTLEVSGGTIQTKKDAIIANIQDKQSMDLSITGGKILTTDGDAIVVNTDGDAVAPKDFVTGGTFSKVPSAYVPSYCVIRDNADGTYTVISSYKITFNAGAGSGSMDSVKVRCGNTYKLPKSGFTAPKGKDFAGWEIGGKTYKAGGKFTPEDDTTVTALWKDHVHSGGKATCQKKAVCKGCGKSYGSKGSHSLVNYSGYDATCTEAGMCEHSKCSTCGKYFVSGISISASDLAMPALGHNWQSVDGKPATCTEDGLYSHEKCANCGSLQMEGAAVAEEALLIAATGHALENVAASQATCADPGVQAHEHCTACGGQFLKGEAVEAAQLITATSSHVLSDWVSDEIYHWKTCLDCQEVFRQSAHADTDANGTCDECGYALAAAKENADSTSGFSRMSLIPIIAAVAISAGVAIPLALKKRK